MFKCTRYISYSDNKCLKNILTVMCIHIHYIDKSIGPPTGAFMTSHSKFLGINMKLVPPFAAILISGKAFYKILENLHSSSSQRCSSQGSVRASQILPHQTHPTRPLWTMLCALGHSHAGTEKGLPLTVSTKLEA